MKSKQRTDNMRVSFELDEVLFVVPNTHETEPPLPFPLNRMYPERLRLGTPELVRELQAMSCEVWVYTSSFRTERYIRALFRHYGVRFDGIVNGERHLREVQRNNRTILPQKLPNHYHISCMWTTKRLSAPWGRNMASRPIIWTRRMMNGRKRSLNG